MRWFEENGWQQASDHGQNLETHRGSEFVSSHRYLSGLEGAGCADVMAIQPPRGQKPWPIKAKPAKDSSEDFYGISTVEHTLLLSKVPPRAPYILGVQGLRPYRWKPYNSYHSQGAIEEAEEPLPSQMESGGSHGTAASSTTSTTG